MKYAAQTSHKPAAATPRLAPTKYVCHACSNPVFETFVYRTSKPRRHYHKYCFPTPSHAGLAVPAL